MEAIRARVETTLVAGEHRAEKAEKHIETLEELIRNEFFSQNNTTPSTSPSPPPSPPQSPPPSIAPVYIPGDWSRPDLTRVTIPEIKKGEKAVAERVVDWF